MKPRRRIRLFVFIAIAAALIPFVIWLNMPLYPGHLPCEPPIKEQLDQQIRDIEYGITTEMPIPLIIYAEEINRLEITQIEQSLIANEWNLGYGIPTTYGTYKTHYSKKFADIEVDWDDGQYKGRQMHVFSISSALKAYDMSGNEIKSHRYEQDISLAGIAKVGDDQAAVKAALGSSAGFRLPYVSEIGQIKGSVIWILMRGIYSYGIDFTDGKVERFYVMYYLPNVPDRSDPKYESKLTKELKRTFGIYTPFERAKVSISLAFWTIKNFFESVF
ncbi:MAG: hypothetical protein HRF49_05080 [bacterium]|jgi:hypothetical protein